MDEPSKVTNHSPMSLVKSVLCTRYIRHYFAAEVTVDEPVCISFDVSILLLE